MRLKSVVASSYDARLACAQCIQYSTQRVFGMPYTLLQSIPAFVPEALASSQVGVWYTDFDKNKAVCDATTAAIFGVDAIDAASGINISHFVRAIHPHDRAMYEVRTKRMRENGGLYVVEYRTVPRPGEVRWILVRGRYERDPSSGNIFGRGIVIDVTDSKLDGMIEDKVCFLAPDAPETMSPLDRTADHMLRAREAADDYTGRDAPALRRTINAVLWVVGRLLARQSVAQMN